jgi:hypothetical protein
VDGELRGLAARLERAERELRIIRRVGRGLAAGVFIAAIGASLFVATRSDAQKAELSAALERGSRVQAPFTVVDRQGRPIVRVVANGDARGMLVYDRSGHVITGSGQGAEGSGVAIYYPNGQIKVGLGQSANGQGLTVFDENGLTATWVGVGVPGPNQGRGILVKDATSATVAKLGIINQEDLGELRLYDRAGSPTFQAP